MLKKGQKKNAKTGRKKTAPRKRPAGPADQPPAAPNARMSGHHWQELVETSAAWIWETDADLHHTYTNAFVTKCLGYRPAEFLKLDTLELIHPDDRALVKELVRNAAHRREGWSNAIMRWRHKDGSWRFIESSGVAVFDRQDNCIGFRGVDRDVTDRVRSESALRESENRFRTLFENLSVVALVLNPADGRILDANEAAAAYYGWPREQLRTMNIAQINSLSPEEIRARMAQVERSKQAFFLFRHRRADGSVRDVEVYSGPIRFEGRTALYSIVHDVTERTRAENALKQSEDRFRKAFTTSPDAVNINRLSDSRYLSINKGFTQIMGYSEEEVIGRTSLELNIWVDSEDRKRLADELRERGEVRNLEARFRMKSGAIVHGLMSASVIDIDGVPHILSITRDITERKKAEEQIAERGALLQQIMDTASVAIFLVDKAGRITHANRKMAEMFGCALEELVGSEYVAHVHPSERETGRKNMLALLASAIPSVDVERHYWRSNGSAFWGHLAGRRFYDVRGNELGLIGVITDISERKRMEDKLRDSEARLNTILDNVGAYIFIKDTQYRYTYANRKVGELLGVSMQDILGRGDEAFFSAESVEEIMRSDRSVIEQGETVARAETGLAVSGGTPRTYWTVKLPLRDSNGAITGLCGISTDITDRRRAEEALQKSERMLQTIIDTGPDCIKIIDRESRLVMMNRAGLHMIQAGSLDQVRGQVICPLLAPEHQQPFMDLTERVFQGGSGILEFQMTGMRGRQLWLETHAVPLRDEKNEIIALLGVTRDISERKQAEEALRESEERFRAITMTASDAILLMDDAGRIIYWNPAAERIFGYPAGEVIGQDLHVILAPERLHKDYHDGFARFVTTGRGPVINRSVEMVAMRKNGVEFPIEVSTSAMNIGGKWHALGIVRDITERKQLEQERLKAQKLESVGTLAGGIAHDFNNLLQGVFGYISMAKLTFDQREKSFAMLEQAEKALHQSVSLTSQLLTFSKGGKPVKKAMDLRPVIEDAVTFSLSGSRTASRLSLAEDLHPVDADAGQIGQAVQNIVLNADQAMPEGGTIEIVATNLPEGAASALGLGRGSYVELSIRDQGIGIQEQHLAKIFDPYFTTKEKGSGLGLATTYSIVRNHDGLIKVSSEPGKGSLFQVYLPASARRPDPVVPQGSAVSGRSGRILVMDDEELVRKVAGDLLRELGHDVELAGNGEAALEKFQAARQAGSPFDIVILDLTVRGGMGGAETVHRLREIDPDVTAVVSSGYSDSAVTSAFQEHGFRAFLRKPYDTGQLRDLLTRLLA